MRLVTILGLFNTILLNYSTSFDGLIPQILSKHPQHDVAFVNCNPDLLESVLPCRSSANPVRIINRVHYPTDRQCSVFFLQLPMSDKQVSKKKCWLEVVT